MSTGIPSSYTPILTLKQTEQAIKLIKDFFEQSLSAELRLRRVTAPLFVPRGTGINDDLNGVERPASFPVKHLGEKEVEMVQSLAKWKRMALADYNLEPGYGLYTDMNAVRPDDLIDNIHSIYVDQWDWELIMDPTQRNVEFLKSIVRRIYAVLRRTEFVVQEYYPNIEALLPEEIRFIHTEEARELYPDLTPKQRERELTRQYGAVFLIGIGGELTDGTIHDGRAPDYDDWSTPADGGLPGLNGDILVWNPVLEDSFELSSMGIRVDRDTLLRQLEIRNLTERKELYWHKRLLNGEFPQSIGGGIGQSRLCMYYLRKAHIGEVQSGLWQDETVDFCRKRGIPLM
jgi:aspartate--ammonia ligase